MTSKRDLNLVRLACRRELLSAEEGEACLALARKLEGRISMEEVIRRQANVSENDLAALVQVADQTGRRRRGVAPAAKPRSKSRHNARPSVDVPPSARLGDAVVEHSFDDDEPPDEVTMLAPSPFAAAPPRENTQFFLRGIPVNPVDLEPAQLEPVMPVDLDPVEPEDFEPDLEESKTILQMPAIDMSQLLPEVDESTLDSQPEDEIQVAVEELQVELEQQHRIPWTLPTAEEYPEAPVPVGVIPEEEATEDSEATALLRDQPEMLVGPFGAFDLERVVARYKDSAIFVARRADNREVRWIRVLATDNPTGWISSRAQQLLAASSTKSPHVVRLIDVGTVGDLGFVESEAANGFTLEERLLAGEPVTGAESWQILRDVARALLASHTVEAVHGALDADAVLLDPAVGARVMGFGLQKDPGPPSGDLESLYLLAARLCPPEEAQAMAQAGVFSDASHALAAFDQRLEEARLGEQRAASRGNRMVAVRAVVIWLAVIATLLAITITITVSATMGLWFAFAAAASLQLALTILATLGLIRRGRLPLPTSSSWLVRFEEASGLVGGACLVVGLAAWGPAGLHLGAAALAAALLFSRVFGVSLRRHVAAGRPDKGVGRALAVLSDVRLGKWRRLHAPLLAGLTAVATVRFALIAYFSAG